MFKATLAKRAPTNTVNAMKVSNDLISRQYLLRHAAGRVARYLSDRVHAGRSGAVIFFKRTEHLAVSTKL